ncbi:MULTISPECIES: hypothetical protein [Moorena]|uniref:ATP-grasp domain-containing protein n=1 Tax=Moorena bouillonii PNG TaxID=568701 RepID=A0A1U7N4X9_9CYAN|nr:MULTISPECIES: hypothetical protein [Moorena]NEO15405.1 hypothetical protein [Moorena sp. SIO3E8]NEQ01825.1 hypothetical protein [Moorena sp. SIO3F7]OLT60986.1 hypothetical protein BJP37_20170 [Moorena bouillonii PNG]
MDGASGSKRLIGNHTHQEDALNSSVNSNAIAKSSSILDLISSNSDQVRVFAFDIRSQPHFQGKNTLEPWASRALAVAGSEDVVIIPGNLDAEYYDWLKNLGLGPQKVFAFNRENEPALLSELIMQKADEVRAFLASIGKPLVFVPYYSADVDKEAASTIDAVFFGCDQSITLKYFDKSTFKSLCQSLGIPTVPGTILSKSSDSEDFETELRQEILGWLKDYETLLIRGAQGSVGSSLYKVNRSNLDTEMPKMLASGESCFLIEPFLKVITSPNDQWMIGSNGEIAHLGITCQLFNGLQHIGNVKGKPYSKRIEGLIRDYSFKIAQHMRDDGYLGILGIDYIVTDQGIFPIENNARLNGSSFAFFILDNLFGSSDYDGCWKVLRIKIEPCSFSTLREKIGSLIYQGNSTQNFVFPYEFDTLRTQGDVTLLIVAEDLHHLEYVEKELLSKLEIAALN